MRFLNLFAFILLSSIAVLAQSGSIKGRVSYGNGVALHDASVKISQLNRETKTDDSGNFSFSSVPAGSYSVIVHMEGFADVSRVVSVQNAEVSLDVRLNLSAVKAEVTVTSSGTEQSTFDSFQTVNSVSSVRVMEKASVSLGEVLEHESGVAKRSFGVGNSRPVIRGFDGDRVLVLQNGVRAGAIGSQSGDHGEPVDTLSSERIEVVKGPGTLLYGSNAIGGVVNVIENDENQSHPGFRGFLTTIGSTADKMGAFAGNAEYGVKNWLFRGNFSTAKNGDYQTPLGRVQNSAARSTSGSFGAGYFGKNAYLFGRYSADIRRYGVPFAPLFEAEEAALRPAVDSLPITDSEIDLRMRRYNTRFTGGFRDLNAFVTGVQYSFDYTNYRHKELETADGLESVGTVFDNKTFSYRSLFEQKQYGKLTGRFGVEGFKRDYQVNGAEQLISGKVKHNAFSVFALEEIGFERVKFQFGARVEDNRYNPQNSLLSDRSYTGFSGAAGINVSLWQGGAFVANYTNSFRAPSLEELYNNGPHPGNVTFEIGNENLTRERAQGFDFSIRHSADKFRLHSDFYIYNIKNFVFMAFQDEDEDGEVDIEDGLPVASYTQANARYSGVEVGADATFNSYVSGYANFDYVRALLTDNDLSLPRIPPSRARLGLNFMYKNLTVSPEAIFTGKQDKTYLLETRTAGYGLFNVTGNYTIGKKHFAHIFTFNAYNLLDREYRNHLNFVKEFMPEIGRGIKVGYTIRFF